MTNIDTITLEVADPAAAERFYTDAFWPIAALRFRAAQEPSTGFRGFTLSRITAQPADVDALIGSAVEAGATTLKAPAKSMWGYGAVVQAPDGTIWKVATPSKKNTGPVTREVGPIVLLLGVADVAASKKFYTEQGFTVGKSFGRVYVEFDTGSSPVNLALYRRKALAKDAGVAPEGTGSHRIAVGGVGSFTDPDGFAWEATSAAKLP